MDFPAVHTINLSCAPAYVNKNVTRLSYCNFIDRIWLDKEGQCRFFFFLYTLGPLCHIYCPLSFIYFMFIEIISIILCIAM
jgi:hypothetical protein